MHIKAKRPIFAQILARKGGNTKMFPLSIYSNYRNVIEHKIPELLEEKFQEPGFTDFFLVDLKIGLNNKVEVFVDSDTSVTFEKCRKISRFLESYIDEKGWLGEKYTLEVSSPGIGRPLKFLRQYRKNIGRKVVVNTTEGKRRGVLTAVTEEMITVEWEERVKQGKKKIKQKMQAEIPVAQIEKIVVKISFN